MLSNRTRGGNGRLTYLAKMPLLLLTKLSKNLRPYDNRRAHTVTIYRGLYINCRLLDLPMDRGRQGSVSLLEGDALPASGHSRGCSADEPLIAGPFGGIANYTGP